MQVQGKRRRGRPEKRWLYNIKDLKNMTDEMAENESV